MVKRSAAATSTANRKSQPVEVDGREAERQLIASILYCIAELIASSRAGRGQRSRSYEAPEAHTRSRIHPVQTWRGAPESGQSGSAPEIWLVQRFDSRRTLCTFARYGGSLLIAFGCHDPGRAIPTPLSLHLLGHPSSSAWADSRAVLLLVLSNAPSPGILDYS